MFGRSHLMCKFDDLWPRLKVVSQNVVTLTRIDREVWINSIHDVYAICMLCGYQLYHEIRTFLDQHVALCCEKVRASGDILVAYEEIWHTYRRGIGYLNNLYVFLNSQIRVRYDDQYEFFTSENDEPRILKVEELGMELWQQKVIEPLKEELIPLLFDGVKNDRCGVSPNQPVLYSVIQSLVEVEKYKTCNLTLYQTLFENRFISDTREYYSDCYRLQLSRLLQENNCSQFLKKVSQILDEENLRCLKYLHPSSYSKVTKACGEIMIADNLQYLCEKCKIIIQQENKYGVKFEDKHYILLNACCLGNQELKMMYKILKCVSMGFNEFIMELQLHIAKNGREIISNLNGDTTPQIFVESVQKFFTKYQNLIIETTNSDERVISAFNKACTEVINWKENQLLIRKQPELLARYCDTLLKKNSKDPALADIKDKLSQAIKICTYIQDKDLFQKLYSQKLAKRLVFDSLGPVDVEELVIKEIKQTCCNSMSSSMIAGIILSRKLNESFANYIKDNSIALGLNFSVSVFPTGSWPLSSVSPPFVIPHEFGNSIQKFEVFYNSKFSRRKLTWLHDQCYADVKLCYLKKSCTVVMNSYQVAVLLLFEEIDCLTFAQIKERIKLDDDNLRKSIGSLVDSKLLLLTDESSTSYESDSLFTLNLKYWSKSGKFRIVLAKTKEEVKQELQKACQSIQADHKLYIKAAIVRIMKSHKIVEHNDLVAEVIHQITKFVPDVSLINMCIKILIDTKYLERTSDSCNKYRCI